MSINVSTKTMVGWMLIVGPILAFLIWGILYDAIIGTSELEGSAGIMESLQMGKDGGVLTTLFAIIGSLGFIGMLIAFSIKCRSILDENGNGLAAVGLMTFMLSAVLITAGTSMGYAGQVTFGEGGQENMTAAVSMDMMSDAIGAGMPLFMGISFLLLGLAITSLKKTTSNTVISWLFIAVSAFMLITVFVPDLFDGMVGMIAWLIMTLTAVYYGVSTLRE
ncbi:MAG: hypothetical protein FI687_00560 [SAR202 cluster bacterium]|mgnify:CR=1 FL=1|nr:hypothetical protein [SAR202 cluster bacterium]|tara:strand:+ start:10593 stop:11255 length:663 start_codon:yes stop_codon:yes gene_type:complete